MPTTYLFPNPIHTKSASSRFLAAVQRLTVGNQSCGGSLIKKWLRFPIEYSAARRLESVPEISVSDLFPNADLPTTIALPKLERHSWNVKLDEKILIGLIGMLHKPKTVFEIGTFDGGTTLHLGKSTEDDCRIYTLDLPPADFDRTQEPGGMSGDRVGHKFWNTPEHTKITQLRGNSVTFDYSPYENQMDLVFVDAAHDYIHGYPDSMNALRLVKSGGIVLWHDCSPYWSELVHAICDATDGMQLQRLSGTSVAVLRKP